ncbi:putative Small nuclear ribonucleoprotein Sm D2 [Giardia muris]|uniref:Putative Small nuclear ribonucleoprotein Sm D2 n=1 Tax=Giardia muris TaxID=5742 RepID=A0A4Z1SSH3_GIAMU|nr:putative Small nuclear ribonucleoprotein Sm D2 [Giardia muris]|eukprot:TNJ28856.1 putative Small nuclear ribonucleoprotein Sm D2 [Giardia muris]
MLQSSLNPYEFFEEALHAAEPIVVHLQNGRRVTGILRAYDRHINLVFATAREAWVECGMEFTRERQGFMLRGDTVLFVTKASRESK